MDYLLEVKGLRKRYGERLALEDVSLRVARGTTLGLLGPNGAGKSTTVAIIAGLSQADGGSIQFAGQSVAAGSAAFKHKLGLVPQELAIYEDLTVRENFNLFGALYGLSTQQIKQRCTSLLDLVALSDRVDDFPANFSGGMKRRLNIALALIHDPELVILDEPTVGIDPQSRNAIFDGLESLQAQGKTLIYTSHYMEEVERLADHLLIIDHGKVIADDSPQQLYRRLKVQAGLQLEFLEAPSSALIAELQQLSGVQAVQGADAGTSWHLALAHQSDALGVLNFLAARHIELENFATSKTSLEAIFLQLTGRSLRD